MDNAIFEGIKNLVSEKQGLDPNVIKRTTFLEKDLGIYGTDAVELLIAYSKSFNVDVSNFMAADYFSAEGLDIGTFFCRIFRVEIQKKELSIGDLEKGVVAGRLDEEVIDGNI